MASKRDLVEANAFGRRRLVSAFVSGAPGGREVEPARPARTIVGGLALAVLLMAGAAAAGYFAPREAVDWTRPGLVISRQTGAAYVILGADGHPVLHPVVNMTSARLVLDEVEPTLVSQQTIDQQTIGQEIGIPGAPATLPAEALLIDSGWTACTRDRGGIGLALDDHPGVTPIPTSGFVVKSGGAYYVVAQGGQGNGQPPGAYRYLLPEPEQDRPADADNLLGDLGLPIRDAAVRVPAAWLALFPAGGDLGWRSFGVDHLGAPAPGAGGPGVPGDARVGDVIVSGDRALLLTAAGPAPLDAWALGVYRHTLTPQGLPSVDRRRGDRPRITVSSQPPRGAQKVPSYEAARWPSRVLTPHPGAPCAELTAAAGSAPTVQLASDPGDGATADAVAAGHVERTVAAGSGAYVIPGAWTDISGVPAIVVDAEGRSHPLIGEEAATRLGYGSHTAPVVPHSWVDLLATGVDLSADDAACRRPVGAAPACG